MAIRDSVLSIVIRAKDLAGKTLRKFRGNLTDTDKAGKKTGASIGQLTRRVIALGLAYTGLDRLASKLLDVLKTGDKFERLGIQMEQTMGSIQKGEAATEWIKEFTKSTPLQLEQTTETFIRLKNFGIDPLNGSMQSIVDQAEKLGGGYERVKGISLALGQAWAKQKLQGEEILQLIERGVPVWDLLADVTGKNTKELQELSSAGALGRDVIKQLIDEMGKRSSGAAAQNMSLLAGLVSNLKDEWELFLDKVANSGALDYAKGQLQALLDEVQRLRDSGELDQLAKRISDGMVAAAEAIKGTTAVIKEHVGLIALLGKAYLGLKVTQAVSGVVRFGAAASGAASGLWAATAGAKALKFALRGVWILAVAEAVVTLTQRVNEYYLIQRKLKDAELELAAARAESQKELERIGKNTGLQIKSMADLQRAVSENKLVYDEVEKTYVRTAESLTEVEKATKAAADAEDKAKARKDSLNSSTQALLETYAASQGKGDALVDTIKTVGETARTQGRTGIEALSIAMRDLVIRGKETANGLKEGLVDYLAGLSDDQFDQFGDGIIEAMEKIDDSARDAGVRLSFLQSLLEDQLTAAAKRAGVDISATLTGIDESTSSSVKNLERLAETMKAAGKTGQDADKIFRAGLLQTLQSLDTSKEVDAVVESLRELEKQGEITDKQLAEGVSLVHSKWRELQSAASDTKDAIKDSAAESISSIDGQAAAADDATGAATALADAYKSIRAPIDALGPAARSAFDKLQGLDGANISEIRGEFAGLKAEISDANAELERVASIVNAGFTGVSAFLRKASKDAATVKKEYAEQKLAIEELRKAYDEGAISAAGFARSASAAANSTSLLNNADLSSLRDEIRQAEQQMDSLKKSTAGTVNGLQRELAQLRGDTLEAEKLNYQSRVNELEAKLEEARSSGDSQAISNAGQALSIARQIYRQKRQQISDEAKAQKVREAERDADDQLLDKKAQLPAEKSPSVVQATTPQQQKSEMVVHLTAGNQSSAIKTEDPDGLLAVLANAGMKTS